MDFRGVVTEIIKETSYQLDAFYFKSFKDGGLTHKQTDVLYEELQKSKQREIEIQALMHGHDISKKEDKVKESLHSQVPLFGDPDDYKDLSDEEKEEMTKKMMGKHKILSNKMLGSKK